MNGYFSLLLLDLYNIGNIFRISLMAWALRKEISLKLHKTR